VGVSGLSGTCNAPLLGVAYCLAVIQRQSKDPATSVSVASTLTPVNVLPVTLCAVCTVQNVNGDDYENQWLLLFSPKIVLSPGLMGRGWVSRLRYDITTLCMQVYCYHYYYLCPSTPTNDVHGSTERSRL